MEEVKREAKRRKIKLIILPTAKAIEKLKKRPRPDQRHPARYVLVD